MNITKNPLKLYASPKAVIANYLNLPGSNRILNIIRRLQNLTDDEVNILQEELIKNFAGRHRDLKEILLHHFDNVNQQYSDELLHFTENKKLLFGSLVTKEYSIQSAALFNPSIVPHPDQSHLNKGAQRFVMSLRATGEGHISSIIFKTVIIDENVNIKFDAPSPYSTCLKKDISCKYSKSFVQQRLQQLAWYKPEHFDSFPETFTAAEAIRILDSNAYYNNESRGEFSRHFKQVLDSNYELEPSAHLPLNEKVIFPNAMAESMGMEDVRFVKFQDADEICYYGTYTAYNGREIKTQLIETPDFNHFKIRTLYGPAVSDKGMALFPEKINGKYVMVSRQGGELISLMYSEDLYKWDSYKILMEPLYAWEFVQLGNCGSPIKTDEGWLLLTHGVGIMRTYVISAILLELNDPSKIIARLSKPLIQADDIEREGYVPNVVYTCGFIKHGNMLVIPYAVSDSATGFATVSLDELLNELTQNKL
jgi:predicted GH43/DUF377 family glycosyl hydrolase